MHTRLALVGDLLVAGLCCTSPLFAEDVMPALPRGLDPSVFRVPLQPLPASEGEGAGWCAAEERFKARFTDGFAIVPALGDGRAMNLSLRWRTESVAIGGAVLPRDASAEAQRLSPREITYEHGAWSERYEVRPDGVEQYFVLRERSSARGDLEIRGRIETPLTAAPLAPAQQALEFHDERGAAILRYGAALAFDAAGRSHAVETSYADGAIELTLDGAWLAEACYPVTIDPLTSPVSIAGSSGAGGSLSSVDIECAANISPRNVLVVCTRAMSASDHDTYGILCDESFGNAQLVYSNLETAYSDTDASAAFVKHWDRWFIATERKRVAANGELTNVRVFAFDALNPQLNAGVQLMTAAPAGSNHSKPCLGGSSAGSYGDTAILCYQADAGAPGASSDFSEIYALALDAQSPALGPAQRLAAVPAGSQYDREGPSVNLRRWGQNDGWCVAWRELDRQTAGDDWDARGVFTDGAAARVQEAELADAAGVRDVMEVQVDGIVSSYLVACTLSNGIGSTNTTRLSTRRFEWSGALAAPQPIATRVLLDNLWFLSSVRIASLGIDYATRSHWVLGYAIRVPASGFLTRAQAKLVRVGGTGAELETQMLFDVADQSSVPPAAAKAYNANKFLAVYGSTVASAPVQGVSLLPPTGAGVSLIAPHCGYASVYAGLAHAGNTEFHIGLMGSSGNSPAVLLLSLASANVPFPSLGSPSCVLHVDVGAAFVTAIPVMTSSGNALVDLPLPDSPVFRGDFYAQWIHTQPQVGPLGLGTTDGLFVRVR